jgi:nitroimidazol reductase NimA-like FMN-containing flavoprotein (pyridoxamine 5'-phosphate oxidase superfamily)
MNTTIAKVHEFLRHHPLGALATVSADGRPWSSPIYFVVDDNLHFYFVTRRETLKYKNLKQNQSAALSITDQDMQITVQVLGKISEVPPSEAIHIVLDKLERVRPAGDYNWAPPIMKVHKGDYNVLKLIPTTLQYANFKQFKSDIHDDYIEKVI